MKSLFDLGVYSLMANQYALSVTSQNIANSNVPFYSRREVDFSEAFYSLHGNGVNIPHIRRVFDDSLTQSLQMSNSAFEKSDVYLQNVKNFESLFDENSYSIANYLNESLNALNVINANPSSIQSRELYLYQLKNISARFNDIDNNIELQQRNINQSLNADIRVINDTTTRLSQINTKILGASSDEQAELLDQRDELLTTLSKYVSFEKSTDENNRMNIQLTNGTPLVSGSNSYKLVTYPAADPSQLEIGLENGQSRISVTRLFTSGEIGGLLAYQNTALSDAKNSLGRLALVLSQKMNEQQKLGIDLNGNLGGNIFNDINQLEATKSRVINNNNNQGTGDLAVIIKDAGQLTTSDYEIMFDSADHYQLTRKSDHQVVSSGDISAFPTNIEVDGFSVAISSGNFVAGDKFILSPTKNAAKDLSVNMGNADKLALGFPVVTDSSPQNVGTGSIKVTAMTDTSNTAFSIPGNLKPPIRVEFVSDTRYRLVNADDNSLIEDELEYDPVNGTNVFPTSSGFDPGYRVNLSGAMHAGDQFSISYNVNGEGDNRNGLLLAELYKKGVLENDTLSFSQTYQLLSSSISSKVKAAQLSLDSSTIIKTQAESRRDQLSGVSLQEETINLSRYQQACEASAKIIDAGQKMFDIVLGLSRS